MKIFVFDVKDLPHDRDSVEFRQFEGFIAQAEAANHRVVILGENLDSPKDQLPWSTLPVTIQTITKESEKFSVIRNVERWASYIQRPNFWAQIRPGENGDAAEDMAGDMIIIGNDFRYLIGAPEDFKPRLCPLTQQSLSATLTSLKREFSGQVAGVVSGNNYGSTLDGGYASVSPGLLVKAFETVEAQKQVQQIGGMPWKVASAVTGAAGAYYYVKFSGDWMRYLLGDKAQEYDGFVKFVMASSFADNLAINYNTLLQLPNTLKQIPSIVEKIFKQAGEAGFAISKKQLVIAMLTVLAINVGSFFSNLEFAKESTQGHLPVWENREFWMAVQLIANIALVIRATAGASVAKGKPEEKIAAQAIRVDLLRRAERCLSDQNIAWQDLELLAQGKTVRGQSFMGPVLAGACLACITIYASAFGLAAAKIVGGDAGVLVGLMSGTGKALLLSKPAMQVGQDLSDLVQKYWREEEILGPDGRLGNAATWVISVVTLLFSATTFGSAAKITSTHLMSRFVDKEVALKVICSLIGAGGSFPINFRDTVKRFLSLSEAARKKDFAHDPNVFVRNWMHFLCALSNYDVVQKYAQKEDVGRDTLIEKGFSHNPLNLTLAAQAGLLTNDNYEELVEALRQLAEAEQSSVSSAFNMFLQQQGIEQPAAAVMRPTSDASLAETSAERAPLMDNSV